MIEKVFTRNVSWRFYAKSKFCVCFEVHIPVIKKLVATRLLGVYCCIDYGLIDKENLLNRLLSVR